MAAAAKKPAQNSKKTAGPPGKPFEKGKSGNPGGRPKNRQSITYWINEFGNMTPVAAGKLFKVLAKELDKGGDELSIFAIVALRSLIALMNEPTPGLFSQILERTEGKVSQPIDLTWRAPWVEMIRTGRVTFAQVSDELDKSLAAELFAEAGIPVSNPAGGRDSSGAA